MKTKPLSLLWRNFVFASLAACVVTTATAQTDSTPTGPYTLPPLPYAYEALQPHIDAETMRIHHDKHHQAYITNANKLLADQLELAKLSPEELLANLDKAPEAIRVGRLIFAWQLDLKDAFATMVLGPQAKRLSTFTTPRGKVRWNHGYFGHKNFPAEFQILIMEKVVPDFLVVT